MEASLDFEAYIDVRLFLSSFFKGLELWYNEQEYEGAMELWLQYAFDDWEQHCQQKSSHNDDHRMQKVDDDDKTYSIQCLEEFWKTQFINGNTSTRQKTDEQNNIHRQQQLYSWAKLVVFLAGCCLDAGRYETARKCIFYCFYCLHHSNPTHQDNHETKNNIIENALEEYMASYREEEKHLEKDDAQWNDHPPSIPSWIVARKVAQLALQYQQQQQQQQQQQPNMTLPLLSLKWVHEYQRAAFPYRPLLLAHSKPIYHRSEFPSWCFDLEAKAPAIQQEFERLWNQQQKSSSSSFTWPCVGGDHRESGQHDGDVVTGDGAWKELVVLGTGAIPSHWAPVTEQSLPPCVRDLVHAGAGEAIFSVLLPGTRVQPHTASHNLRLMAHLGLQIPQSKDAEQSCYLQVADQKLFWETGKVLVFDDSYEHSVVNDSNEIRAILLLRFWHPALNVAERHIALQHVLDSQHEDRLRRCNPPIPYDFEAAELMNAERRRMEHSSCIVCGASGFQSIRLLNKKDTHQQLFVCICGHPV
jgi:beta-hydroxylase